jgi:NAD(P)-dependent dehydrogenase (short-subunit alcohol dehydrogenase family)
LKPCMLRINGVRSAPIRALGNDIMASEYYEHLFGVSGKVALVTGGTRGIGLMIAEGLIRCGARVYIASRKPDACAEVSTIAGCEALAGEVAARESRLDILVNNAGLTWSEDIDKFSEKAWDKVMDLDIKGPFFLIQKLLPLIRAAASNEQRASIVNVSSVNGLKPSGLRNYSYVAAKAGLNQLTAQLARDLMDEHINVNCIAPGPFQSKMTAPLYATPELEEQVRAGFPMKRWGSVEDAAGLTIFLSSRAGSYLTGVTLPLDGGSTTIG